MIGRTLAHYRISAALGAGGMGEVYRATDTTLGPEVAIKVVPAELAGDAERLARFERESKLLASLNHPNIAHVSGRQGEGARLRPGQGVLAAAGIILGTAAYMSPEQACGKALDKRADIWAFGVVGGWGRPVSAWTTWPRMRRRC